MHTCYWKREVVLTVGSERRDEDEDEEGEGEERWDVGAGSE